MYCEGSIFPKALGHNQPANQSTTATTKPNNTPPPQEYYQGKRKGMRLDTPFPYSDQIM